MAETPGISILHKELLLLFSDVVNIIIFSTVKYKGRVFYQERIGVRVTLSHFSCIVGRDGNKPGLGRLLVEKPESGTYVLGSSLTCYL